MVRVAPFFFSLRLSPSAGAWLWCGGSEQYIHAALHTPPEGHARAQRKTHKSCTALAGCSPGRLPPQHTPSLTQLTDSLTVYLSVTHALDVG